MPELKVHASSAIIERMVHEEDSREGFSARLKDALAHAGQAGRGEGARLAKIAKVTPKAASKWLNGEARPGHDKLVTIAKAMGVRPEWLDYGNGPMISVAVGAAYSSGPEIGSSQQEGPRVGNTVKSASEPPDHANEKRAKELAPLATPRSQEALDHIAQAAREGRLTEEDLLLLEQIANKIAAQPARAGDNDKNHPHERLRETLGKHDPSAKP